MAFRFFEQLVDPFPPRVEGRSPSSVFRFCRHYARGLEPYLLVMALLSTAIAIVEVALFEVMGQVVDLLAAETPETLQAGDNMSVLWWALGLMAAFPLLVGLQSLLLHQTLMGNFPMIVRWLSHRYLLRQSLGFFHDEFAGRIATRVMQTALAVRTTVIKLLDIMVYVSVYFFSVLALFAAIDWRMMLPLAIWFGVYALILYILLPRLEAISEAQADARSMMTGRIADSYTNITTVKLFSHAKREAAYAREGMQEFMGTVHPQMRLVTWMESCVAVNNTVMLLAVGSVSIFLWYGDAITPGVIAAAIALCLRLFGMSEWIMWEVSDLFENIGTVRDGTRTLSQPIDVEDAPEAGELSVSRGQIAFSGVGFSYGGTVQVFDDLDLTIAPGEKVGIIGRSGAGKSTLVNLLLRFYDVGSGTIRIDGEDIRSVTQASLRANIGMVTQDTSLLHRTVRENILYGREDATEEEVLAAVEQARAAEFIAALEDQNGQRGLDARVGERGVKLSGGQRQRIAIARVMLKDAPILVLDEATSALDSEVELAIQDSLYQLMEGKTVIAIAHRLSTIAALDRLVVLDGGRVVESGSHSELLANGGIYKRLWDYQSGGFLAPD